MAIKLRVPTLTLAPMPMASRGFACCMLQNEIFVLHAARGLENPSSQAYRIALTRFMSFPLFQHRIASISFKSHRLTLGRLLAHLLLPLTPSLIPALLLTIRTTLFPSTPVSARKKSSTTPCRAASVALLNALPQAVAHIYFGPNTRVANEGESEHEALLLRVEDLLHVADEPYVNRHVVYSVLELVVARLAPELKDAHVGGLLAERGVSKAFAD